MARLKLGEILINQGFITDEQLQEAILVQKVEKKRIGEIFVQLKMITEENMTQALGNQLGIPYYSSDKPELLSPPEDQHIALKQLIPVAFAIKNDVIPISKHMNSLTCVLSDPLDLLLIDNLKRMTLSELNLVIATRSTIQKAIKNFYGDDGGSRDSMLNKAVERSYSDSKDFIASPERTTSA